MKRTDAHALGAIVLCLGLAACNPQPAKSVATPTSSAPNPTPSALSLKITGRGSKHEPIRMFQQLGNRKQYELQTAAYESRGASGKFSAILHTVHATFYEKDGTTLIADAPRAVVDQSANTVTLQGGVHARNSAGMTLACDQLVYSRATEMVHGTGNVVITDPNGMRATGSRFDSDLTLTHAQMQ